MTSVLIVLLLGLLAFACSPGEKATTAASPTVAPAATPGPASLSTPERHVVIIKDFAFNPPRATIKSGESITWRNMDTVPHTSTGAEWNSGTIQSGQAYSRVFDKPGTYSYRCTIHPFMDPATVEVQ
ncbi:MAG: cupredoxin domain-containing protein [Chloroflexi bacterium]|nr:cupredoxin domain-containing protein [Chloroflexota bacterium]